MVVSPHLQRTATACIFLAAKVQEAPLRTNDLVNVAHYLLASPDAPLSLWQAGERGAGHDGAQMAAEENGQEQQGSQQHQPAQQPLSKADMLAGDDYYQAKDTLIEDEQMLLRVLRFNIDVQQPHKWLFSLCRAVDASVAVVRVATCVLNDALVSGLGATGYRPVELAAAAVHTSERIVQPDKEADAARWAVLGLLVDDIVTLSNCWLAFIGSRS